MRAKAKTADADAKHKSVGKKMLGGFSAMKKGVGKGLKKAGKGIFKVPFRYIGCA